MNHLQKAKDISKDYEDKYIDVLIYIGERLQYLEKNTRSLDKIAEQLEKMNDMKLLGSREFDIKWIPED